MIDKPFVKIANSFHVIQVEDLNNIKQIDFDIIEIIFTFLMS